MLIVPAKKQDIWGWPAVINFSFGGTAAGFFLVVSIATFFQAGSVNSLSSLFFHLPVPLLVGLGFMALMTEVGRPSRVCYVVRHVASSWMSIESMAGFVLIIFSVVDWFFSAWAIQTLASVTAALFLFSQGSILFRSRAITAWNIPVVPLFSLISGVCMGYGLLLMIIPLKSLVLEPPMLLVGAFSILINLAIWLIYLFSSKKTSFKTAVQQLRQTNSLVSSIVVGHISPLFFLFMYWMNPGSTYSEYLLLFAGLALLVNGTLQKAGMLFSAGHFRTIAFNSRTLGTEFLSKP